MAGIALLLLQTNLFAQITLNWASSFSPAWGNGDLTHTASNIGGNSINCTATISMTGSGVFMPVMGSSGAQSPSVSGAVFTIPGATNRIQITPNYTNTSSYTDIVLSFSAMTTNVSFRIVDIDKNDASSTTYFDRVTVTGSNGSTSFNPVLTKFDPVTDPNFLVLSGNTAQVNTTSGQAGNTASDATDQRGTITVDFGSSVINSISIRYDNAPGTNSNPASQSIAIGDVSFLQSTLPVSLVVFSGRRQGQDVVLNWTTRQEFNSAFFEIERSNGTSSWEKIGAVTAAGNSNTDIDYSFLDVNPQGSLLLYRLKQTDIDNHYKYSGIVRITAKAPSTGLQAYPNPFREQVNISLYSPVQQQVSVALLDAAGRRVRTETKKLFAGENSIMVPGPGSLVKGVYHIVAYDAAGNMLGRSKIVRD
ncbi:MAG: T9SS type A sorting domain-containing protein [Bacteroidota bacterium]